MNKHFKILFSLITILFALASCGDLLEHSQNDKLDGYWKLTTIDTLATGGQKNVSEQSVHGGSRQNHDAQQQRQRS